MERIYLELKCPKCSASGVHQPHPGTRITYAEVPHSSPAGSWEVLHPSGYSGWQDVVGRVEPRPGVGLGKYSPFSSLASPRRPLHSQCTVTGAPTPGLSSADCPGGKWRLHRESVYPKHRRKSCGCGWALQVQPPSSLQGQAICLSRSGARGPGRVGDGLPARGAQVGPQLCSGLFSSSSTAARGPAPPARWTNPRL